MDVMVLRETEKRYIDQIDKKESRILNNYNWLRGLQKVANRK